MTDDASTHWETCGFDGGPRHYECLLREHNAMRHREPVHLAAVQAERDAVVRHLNDEADETYDSESVHQLAERIARGDHREEPKP